MKSLTIKEMSEKTRLSIPTLRYYEEIGLLDPVERAANGHRRYTEKDLLRVDFLKRVRATGMTIKEMQHYVDLFRAGDVTLAERLAILQDHRQAVQDQIDALVDTVQFLDTKIERYLQEKQSQSVRVNS